jgi:hypothetical protein
MIFISYSLKDKAPFTSLCMVLKSEGLSYWDGRLKTGASLKQQLREAISKCDVCIFIATESSVNSQWCLNEIGAFWGAGKRIILYAAHHDIENKLPPLFKGDFWTSDAEEVIRQVKVELKELAEKATTLSAPPAQPDEHDRDLFKRFLNRLPSNSKAVRFLHKHDSGVSFPSEWLDPLYHFTNHWSNAEHEFNNPDLEKKRLEFWNTLDEFLRDLGQYTSSIGREGWLSIGLKDWEDRPEMLEAHRRLNDGGNLAYEAHQSLVREAKRLGISVRTE